MTARPLPVHIVFRSRRQGLGRVSTRARLAQVRSAEGLRLRQIREVVAPHLPEHVSLTFSSFSPHGRLWNFDSWLRLQRPAVFLLLKHIGYGLTPEQIARLKAKAIAVGIDHKDGDLAAIDLAPFDFHISASRRGLAALDTVIDADASLRARGVFAGLFHQSHDPRLDAVRPAAGDRLAPVYIGRPSYAEIPPSLADAITVLSVLDDVDMVAALPRLGAFNLHFAVRPAASDALLRPYKPFTKGVTAAACRANILVNRQVDDAEDFLGPDYPYLVASNRPPDVEAGFRRAVEDFGGPDWARGLEIMRAVRDRVSARALAAQFVAIVNRAAAG